jgi:hypothetical protein
LGVVKFVSTGLAVALISVSLTACSFGLEESTQSCLAPDGRGKYKTVEREIPESIPSSLTVQPDQIPISSSGGFSPTADNLKNSLRYFTKADTTRFVDFFDSTMTADQVVLAAQEYPKTGLTLQATVGWSGENNADRRAGVDLEIGIHGEPVSDKFLADRVSAFIGKGGVIHADGQVFELPYFEEDEFFCDKAPYGYYSEKRDDDQYYDKITIGYNSFEESGGEFELPTSKTGNPFKFTPKELIHAIARDSNAYLKLIAYGFEQRYYLNEDGYVTNAVYAAAAVENLVAQAEYGILWSESASSKLLAEARANAQPPESVDPDSSQGILNSLGVATLERPRGIESAYDEKYVFELASDPQCLTSSTINGWKVDICLDVLFTFQKESSSFLRVGLNFRDGETSTATADSLCKGIEIKGETLSLTLDGRSGCPPIFLVETGTLEEPEEFLLSLARSDFVVSVLVPSGLTEYKFSRNEKLKERENFERMVLARKALLEGLQHRFFD